MFPLTSFFFPILIVAFARLLISTRAYPAAKPSLTRFRIVTARHEMCSRATASLETRGGTPYEIVSDTPVLNPSTGKRTKPILSGSFRAGSISPLSNFLKGVGMANLRRKTLVIVMPQLGDFDTAEYAELLVSVLPDLEAAGIGLSVVGIGSSDSAGLFSEFTGLPLDVLACDPTGLLHRSLGLHGGPDWDIPKFIPQGVLEWFADYTGASDDPDKIGVARAWLNYMAMCAGVAAPDTLPEILRGYFGDRTAPERLRPDETVRVGKDFIAVTGVTDVKIGPIQYQSLWKAEEGYQRPAELATVRLRAMVEVLTKFKKYVPDQKYLHLRGATYLFDTDGSVLYEHRDTGVLAYSKTMARPLTFLGPYIGEDRAANPLGLGDFSRSQNSQ